MCGKDWQPSKSLLYRLGSPPHVRERLKDTMTKAHLTRITPACAGKTKCGKFSINPSEDHPRMCGKDLNWFLYRCKLLGSPPHVRERPTELRLLPGLVGITPACAGKTMDGRYKQRRGRDHPRMCGKDRWYYLAGTAQRGSPPHVRESQLVCCAGHGRIGITPACAGKTSDGRRRRGHRQDHPRMCGKDVSMRGCIPVNSGSPPHVRERL